VLLWFVNARASKQLLVLAMFRSFDEYSGEATETRFSWYDGANTPCSCHDF
jgi:hypothetical protein